MPAPPLRTMGPQVPLCGLNIRKAAHLVFTNTEIWEIPSTVDPWGKNTVNCVSKYTQLSREPSCLVGMCFPSSKSTSDQHRASVALTKSFCRTNLPSVRAAFSAHLFEREMSRPKGSLQRAKLFTLDRRGKLSFPRHCLGKNTRAPELKPWSLSHLL